MQGSPRQGDHLTSRLTSFRGQLNVLADEFEHVCTLNLSLQEQNQHLRRSLKSRPNGVHFPDEIACGIANERERQNHTNSIAKEDAEYVDRFASSKKFQEVTILDKVCSSGEDNSSFDIPYDDLPEDVPLSEFPALNYTNEKIADLDTVVDLDEVDVESCDHPESSDNGLDLYYPSTVESHASYTSYGEHMDKSTASSAFRRPFSGVKTQVPIFPKWFDPGQTAGDGGSTQPVSPTLHKEYWMAMGSHASVNPHGSIRCVVRPVGRFRLSWDACAFVCVLVQLWTTPFELIFMGNLSMPDAFTILEIAITVFFCADIGLNFITGFVENDRTILDRGVIVKQYLRSWFVLDFIATVPFDLILQSMGSGLFSMARIGKASKVFKTLRYLKLVRAVRLVRMTAQAQSVTQHFHFLDKVRFLFVPAQGMMFLLLFAHVHGCVWELVQSDVPDPESIDVALNRYLQAFWWAFIAVSTGASLGPAGGAYVSWMWLTEMVLASERLMIIIYVSMKVIFRSLTFLDDARRTQAHNQVLKYLRQHRVSFQTQIQVLYSLRDTINAKKHQMYAKELFANELPRELRDTICAELWSARLISLGLIRAVSHWNRDFIPELSLVVFEEVFASRQVLFRVGDEASAAYHIITGELSVDYTLALTEIPDFTRGMWVGESALASALLRRSATIMTTTITSVMVVPGPAFQGLISRFGFTEDFQNFCSKNLWKGLCGRCGSIGEHFSDACDSDKLKIMRASNRARSSKGTNNSSRLSSSAGSVDGGGVGELHFANASAVMDLNAEMMHFNLEMKRYLIQHSLESLMPILREEAPMVNTLDALADIDPQWVKRKLRAVGLELTKGQEFALQEESMMMFRRDNEQRVAQALFRKVSRLHHLIFLSHYKLEAGTEAALMRTELEHAMKKESGSLGHYFDEPVFLDSENLNDLEDLQLQVKRTHNLVLLLTKGVLLRPWVLVEIVTAVREGVRLLLVSITKPGCEFSFPDEDFYNGIQNGNYLNQQSQDVIRHCGITMDDVTDTLREVFKKIAVPYSPHKSGAIRQAEIGALLKQCQLKDS